MVFYTSVYFGATDIRIWESFESRLLVCARMQQKLVHSHAQLLSLQLTLQTFPIEC